MKIKPIFIMCIGLPASGKSTYCETYKRISPDTYIASSDQIREELFGDVNNQSHNKEVFDTLHKRVKEKLSAGTTVIYDATNLVSKRRRAFLDEIAKIPCYKIAIVFATPYCQCLKNNEDRDRQVPYGVMKKMYASFQFPWYFEGWDDIEIKYLFPYEKKDILTWLVDVSNFDQENSHHNQSLGLHSMNVGGILRHDKVLAQAGYLHDCGKPFTKTFVNTKGDATDEAHYYNHPNVGAYESMFFETANTAEVAALITWHMYPYSWNSDKTKLRYLELLGSEFFNRLIKLHKADKEAH